jgi:crotonobetainyl-CoA:carnitine CoA-transferase CaiB-like acyl-CoA transferase
MAISPLTGIRVLDLSDSVRGAYCGKLLACYGATVMRIEAPGGSALRRAGPFRDDRPDPETSALQLYLDTGKRAMTLDLDHPDGQQLLRQLVTTADVLVEDVGQQRMAERGLDYPQIAAIAPDLIYVSVTPFGNDGPYATYQATELTLYALGGYMALTGDPDREPLQGPGAQPSYLASAYAFVGVMAAIWARADGLGGQFLDVSAFEAVAASHQWTISRYSYSGMVQRRIGNRYDSGHPITIYPTADGYISIGISTDEQAQRFFVLIGRPELGEDPRFATNLARLEHADELDAIIAPWFAARPSAEVVALCQEMRVPCARVATIADLLADSHLQQRGFWYEIDHPRAGRLRHPGLPFHLPAADGSIQRAPLLSEQTVEALEAVGLAHANLGRLRALGAI